MIYKEVRRNAQKIIAYQVSLKAKEKLLKKNKAFNTTVLILVTSLLSCIPTNAWIIVSFKEKISSKVGHIVSVLSYILRLSLLNPLIYTVRIIIFRVAFIQMLSRKTLEQAKELEQKIFGSNKPELYEHKIELM